MESYPYWIEDRIKDVEISLIELVMSVEAWVENGEHLPTETVLEEDFYRPPRYY